MLLVRKAKFSVISQTKTQRFIEWSSLKGALQNWQKQIVNKRILNFGNTL